LNTISKEVYLRIEHVSFWRNCPALEQNILIRHQFCVGHSLQNINLLSQFSVNSHPTLRALSHPAVTTESISAVHLYGCR